MTNYLRIGLRNMLTVVISDIHGCYDQLMELMDMVYMWNDDPKQFIFLGDYVDRGPESAKVVQYMIDHPKFICLKGNHEVLFLQGGAMWMNNGGGEAYDSYKNLSKEKREQHINWIQNLPLYYEDEHRIYVHAGLRPGFALEEQTENDMLWIREQFLQSDYDFGKLVVHGHTPAYDTQLRSNRLNIDTGGVFGNKFVAALFKEGERNPAHILEVKGYVRDNF